ncbi:hypothetical protein GQ42DRAFT_164277 [Ramicandelaber brevisporus]|nr:hypothetical protein GQ42DRAFT_164916 [Ramicandelaber brevisporus]KAI8868232.1 hypothetical protein GQ42DRAFT_164277 [Ramicandelaber brevisporus]
MLKHIKSVKVWFAPFSRRSQSVRVFLQRIQTTPNLTINPSCKIIVEQLADALATPRVQVEYNDGKVIALRTDKLGFEDIIERVDKHSRVLQENEDNEG